MMLFTFSKLAFMICFLCLCLFIALEWSKIFKFQFKKQFLWLFSFFVFFSLSILNAFFLSSHEKTIFLMERIVFLSMIWWIFSIFLIYYYPSIVSIIKKFNYLTYFFGYFTIIPFFCSVFLIKVFYINTIGINNDILILYILLLVWINDSAAYFCGKLFGKNKLLIKISPKKTWEGFIGGLFFSILYVYVFLYNFSLSISPAILTTTSIFTILGSVLGDLTESMFKRMLDIKNSSNLIPGHGGLLDRTDSIMSAFPIFICILLTLKTYLC